MKPTAAEIQKEYTRGVRYKESLGRHGMFRQNEINERFYSGDQWHGAGCGEERPLVRQTVIRRIACLLYTSIDPDLFTPLFAVARTAGWCAHRMEEISTGGRIIRPAYKAIAGEKTYVQLADREG